MPPSGYAALSRPFVQYDGTNSTDILDAINSVQGSLVGSIVSETGGALTLAVTFEGGPPSVSYGELEINEDDYVVVGWGSGSGTRGDANLAISIWSPTDWAERWIEVV